MYEKYWIIIFATITAVIFAILAYSLKELANLILVIEVIILPIIYYVGYEVLLDKQADYFSKNLEEMRDKTMFIRDYAVKMEIENKRLKKIKNK